MGDGDLSLTLHRIGAVRFGEFTLKDGRISPFYLDLRGMISHPDVLARVGRAMAEQAQSIAYDRIAGIPYAGLPIGVAMALAAQRPLIYPRKEAKSYGTGRLIEGDYHANERVLMVDDVLTSGGAKLEALGPLRNAGLRIEDLLVVVDREDQGRAVLENAGVRVHSILSVGRLLSDLRAHGAIAADEHDKALGFLRSTR
jgi:uridine monophosphate synthetase